jgi:4-oxalocrotonate tautomerase
MLTVADQRAVAHGGGPISHAGAPAMPEVIVYAVAGRTPEQKKGLMKDITDAVVNFGAKADAVTVQIVESPKTDKAKGGVPFTER